MAESLNSRANGEKTSFQTEPITSIHTHKHTHIQEQAAQGEKSNNRK